MRHYKILEVAPEIVAGLVCANGQIVIPLSDEQKAKLRKLADRLHDAGYEWMELT